MKDKIIVRINPKDEKKLSVLLHASEGGIHWLFNTSYTKDVYGFFYQDRSINEILNFKNWKKSSRELIKVINRIPREVQYVKKHIINNTDDAA